MEWEAGDDSKSSPLTRWSKHGVVFVGLCIGATKVETLFACESVLKRTQMPTEHPDHMEMEWKQICFLASQTHRQQMCVCFFLMLQNTLRQCLGFFSLLLNLFCSYFFHLQNEKVRGKKKESYFPHLCLRSVTDKELWSLCTSCTIAKL